MTVENLQPLLDHTKDARMFFQVLERSTGPSKCARHSQVGQVHSPPETRWWRQRHRGRGRREKVGGKESQQMMEAVQDATAPIQYALATRAGCECIAHALQEITELNPRATVTLH